MLVDYDFGLAYNYIKERSALGEDEFNQRIAANEALNVAYETGEVDTLVFFQRMKEILEFEGSIEALSLAWSDIFKPIPKHIEIAQILSNRYPLCIISNTSDAHIQLLENNFTFFDLFKERVYSHIFGARKPDSRIYEHALHIMEAEAEKSLFIDDRIENIQAAADLGWMTIHLHEDRILRDALLEGGIELP